jgi:hypothetical protein
MQPDRRRRRPDTATVTIGAALLKGAINLDATTRAGGAVRRRRRLDLQFRQPAKMRQQRRVVDAALVMQDAAAIAAKAGHDVELELVGVARGRGAKPSASITAASAAGDGPPAIPTQTNDPSSQIAMQRYAPPT